MVRNLSIVLPLLVLIGFSLGQESTEQPSLPSETAAFTPSLTLVPSTTATLAPSPTLAPNEATAESTPLAEWTAPPEATAESTPLAELTDLPEATAESTPLAELTDLPEATAESTAQASPPSTTPSSTPYALAGQARYQNRPQQDGIELRAYSADGALLAQAFSDAQGQFRLSLHSPPPLRIVARAPLHLSQSTTLSASAAPPVFIVLPGGDLDGDSCIGPADLAQLTAQYGSANPSSDIDGNGLVEASDLAILAANFGLGDACVPIISPTAETAPLAESTAEASASP